MTSKKKEYERKAVIEKKVSLNTVKETQETADKYKGKILVKKSPIFKSWKGVPLSEVGHLSSNEIIAVDPSDKRVQIMLKNGNLQFVSNQIRQTPTGDYPRIVED